ncbi:unnamed protein product [Pocillopora meandrina]|uniref:Uncharacterized protein n=1 Tax=Pocillopora meandrina TaxID=46732 RepID=A0AAU9X7K8_9CNID|nr:unnamed protein product [Pocillopora meandrina]
MTNTAMVPNKTTLPLEISAAPFNWVLLQALSEHGSKVFPQFGGLCDTASVWMLVQALSEHEAKLFTQTLCPSTFKGSAPCFTAEANSEIRLLKWTDGVDVMAMPRAFLSANKTTVSRFSGSSTLPLDNSDWALFQLSVTFLDISRPSTFLSYVPHSLERFPECIDFDKGTLDGPKYLEVIGAVEITDGRHTISWIQVGSSTHGRNSGVSETWRHLRTPLTQFFPGYLGSSPGSCDTNHRNPLMDYSTLEAVM